MDWYQNLLHEKARKKRELMGKMFFPRTPVLLLDFSDKKIFDCYKELIEALNTIGLTTLVITPSKIKERLESARIHYIDKNSEEVARQAADFALSFDTKIRKFWEYGCVPISPLDGDKTVNYNALKESGNGFYFTHTNKWEIFATIIRALETYQFPYDWENLLREILNTHRNVSPAPPPLTLLEIS